MMNGELEVMQEDDDANDDVAYSHFFDEKGNELDPKMVRAAKKEEISCMKGFQFGKNATIRTAGTALEVVQCRRVGLASTKAPKRPPISVSDLSVETSSREETTRGETFLQQCPLWKLRSYSSGWLLG